MSSAPPSVAALVAAAAAATWVAFRQTDYDMPFWDRANSAEARWNHAREGPTQYWALTPEAAWAEYIRYEELSTEAELESVRRDMWVATVPSTGVVDLRAPAERQHWGIEEHELVAPDHERCRELGTELRRCGVSGVLGPSAALDGAVNLTLFGAKRNVAWGAQTKLAKAIPAALTARGRPPEGLVSRVRLPGRRDGGLS